MFCVYCDVVVFFNFDLVVIVGGGIYFLWWCLVSFVFVLDIDFIKLKFKFLIFLLCDFLLL